MKQETKSELRNINSININLKIQKRKNKIYLPILYWPHLPTTPGYNRHVEYGQKVKEKGFM